MTLSPTIKDAIRSRRGILSASETAALFRVSETTVYRIWKQTPRVYNRFRNPLYNAVLRTMFKDESTPKISGEISKIFTGKESDIIQILNYYEAYGPEVVRVLRENLGE